MAFHKANAKISYNCFPRQVKQASGLYFTVVNFSGKRCVDVSVTQKKKPLYINGT
jgi:hypothetical protein